MRYKNVSRYPRRHLVHTALDPLEDVVSWVGTLRSTAYAEHLLGSVHGISGNDLANCARAVSAHADMASGFLDQAFSGPSRCSYLPIYYALLNVAKIVVICRGGLSKLRSRDHSKHGVGWTGSQRRSQDLLTDHVTLYSKGSIALYYEALTGGPWPSSAQTTKAGKVISSARRLVKMRQVYPFLPCVEYEYRVAYGEVSPMEDASVSIEGEPGGKWHVAVTLARGKVDAATKRRVGLLSGLTYERGHYVTAGMLADSVTDAHVQLAAKFRWYLLYPHHDGVICQTPATRSNILMPREFPVLLAFFHLGSVARYDPERMARLLDSKSRGLLEIFRRHGVFQYLVDAWSFIQQSQIVINSDPSQRPRRDFLLTHG